MTGPGIIDADRAVWRSDLVPAGLTQNIWMESIRESLSDIRSGKRCNNIRNRPLSVILDDDIRGKAFERALPRIFVRNRLIVKHGNFDAEKKIDTDFVFRGIDRDYTAELKSSALPESMPTIDDLLARGNMILIATTKKIDVDLNRDVYIQGIYDIQTKDRDAFCAGLNVDISKVSPEEIYYKFKYETLSDAAFFVSWASGQLIKNRWRFDIADNRKFWYQDNGKKAYYTFPISWAGKMSELDNFLRYGEKCYIY